MRRGHRRARQRGVAALLYVETMFTSGAAIFTSEFALENEACPSRLSVAATETTSSKAAG